MSDAAPAKATRREWLGLVALALPCVVVTMDFTILHLAVPRLTEDLRPSPSQLLWIVDIYGFVLAGALVTMGTLGDRIGRRRLLLIGAAAFAGASVLAAFATSAAALIAARAALGLAGATLAPSTLSLIRTLFEDPTERTTAVAVWGTSFALGGAIGPLVGGLLLGHFWWGAVFLVPVPAMALLLAVGPRLLPEYRAPTSGRLDLASAALSLASILAIIYGLKRVAEAGPGATPALAIAVGVALGAAFLRRQRRLDHPFVDLALFRAPVFAVTVAALTMNALVMFASSFLNAQYLQVGLGLSPIEAGLWILPSMVVVTASSMLSPRLAQRIPRQPLMVACLLLCALGFGVLAFVGVGGLAVLVAGSAIAGLGAGPLGTLASEAIVSGAPAERAGAAASIASTSAEFGGALGIAVLGSVAAFVYRVAMAGTVPAGVPPDAARVAEDTVGGAVAAARDLPPETGAALVEAARAAFSEAFVVAAVASAALMVATAGLVAVVAARGRAAPAAPASPAAGPLE